MIRKLTKKKEGIIVGLHSNAVWFTKVATLVFAIILILLVYGWATDDKGVVEEPVSASEVESDDQLRESLKKELDLSRQRIADLQKEIDIRKGIQEELKGELSNLKKENASLKQKLAAKQATIDRLQADLNTARANNSDLVARLDDDHVHEDDFVHDVETQKEEIENLEVQIDVDQSQSVDDTGAAVLEQESNVTSNIDPDDTETIDNGHGHKGGSEPSHEGGGVIETPLRTHESADPSNPEGGGVIETPLKTHPSSESESCDCTDDAPEEVIK